MKTTKTADTAPLNTVQTVLSERGVSHFECILYWFWNDFDHEAVTKNLMKMLEVYIKHEPDDVHKFQKADWMTRFVHSLIELKDQIIDVMNDERPWAWIDTPNGWGRPVKEGTEPECDNLTASIIKALDYINQNPRPHKRKDMQGEK